MNSNHLTWLNRQRRLILQTIGGQQSLLESMDIQLRAIDRIAVRDDFSKVERLIEEVKRVFELFKAESREVRQNDREC